MGEAKTITKTCSRCGRSFETSNNRLRVCPACRARGRRGQRSGGGGGGRRTFSAAGVLARASARLPSPRLRSGQAGQASPGGHGGGGGAISVNTSFYRCEPVGLPPTVVLRGNGTLTALRGSGGWKDAIPGTSLDQMTLYLTNSGYVLAGVVEREGELELTYTRDVVREVGHAEAG
jgi:hypothetical protein